jgi:hypothetical protein
MLSDYETDNFSSFTDDEILEIIDENYYTLNATGLDALDSLLDDFNSGAWREVHKIDDERMAQVMTIFLMRLIDDSKLNVPAIQWHKSQHPSAGLRKA